MSNFIIVNLGWIGAMFSVVGTILNARKNILVWPVWLSGNFIIIAHHIINTNDFPTVILFTVFQISNIYGWVHWNKLKNKTSLEERRNTNG